MRIGWVGVSVAAVTGYGKTSKEIISRLMDKYEVVSIAHEAGGVVVWGGRKYLPLGNGKEVLTLTMPSPLVSERATVETVKMYVKAYNLDLLIGFWDPFALEWLREVGIPYLVYIPIDHEATPKTANYVKDAYKIILYSDFGYEQMLKYFPPSKLALIYHGIDTRTFRVLKTPKEEIRREIANEFVPPLPEDKFLFLFVGANVGPRKAQMQLIYTFKKFNEKHPDAHLVMWTNASGQLGKSYDIPLFLDMLKIKDKVHLPKYNPILMGVPDEFLCKLYNACDVFITVTTSEGFNIPVLESQACGTPVIAPKNTTHFQLIGNHGWLIDNVPEDMWVDFPIYTPYLAKLQVPNLKSALEKMEEAYTNEDLRKKYSRLSRKFALQYDWKRIMPLWYKLLEEVEEDIELFKSVIQ